MEEKQLSGYLITQQEAEKTTVYPLDVPASNRVGDAFAAGNLTGFL